MAFHVRLGRRECVTLAALKMATSGWPYRAFLR
jgi:hypothetical protein